MNKDIKTQLIELQPTRQGAWLKPLLPLIHELIQQGVHRQAIVDLLQEQEKKITFSQLCKALYRWRKAQALSTKATSAINPTSPTVRPQSRALLPLADSSLDSAPITSKADLAKIRDTETPDLNSLAALARQHRKETNS